MSLFDATALLLTLSALFGWINRRFLHLPRSVGLLLMGLAASLLFSIVVQGSTLAKVARRTLPKELQPQKE
jgi:uncharacterized iron-regulated membrane protein